MDLIINADCVAAPSDMPSVVSQGGPLLNVLCCLGFDPANPPYADLLRQYHQLDGQWLVVSPVHWQASHNNAMIVALGSEIGIAQAELSTLFQSFAEYLRADGMELYYHDAYTWLVSANNKSLIQTKPVHHLLNQPLLTEIASLDPSMYWQKLLTESQMFFAAQLNPSLLNGVWLWGGAPLIKKEIKICADESFIAMAKLCSSSVSLYHPSRSLNDIDLLIVNDLSTLSDDHQKQLKKIPVNWYWNNTAYANNSKSWFARLWRTLIHAH